ncbi:MAG: hypothetical protein ACLSHC_10900 [Bilophila wadsworthia]
MNLSASASPLRRAGDGARKTTHYDSAYFDEITTRTAWEHIRGIEPYDLHRPGQADHGRRHPPVRHDLFGWRFRHCSAGCPAVCVPLNLFGRTSIATCGTVLLAADFMHPTQTRLAPSTPTPSSSSF